MDILLDVTIAVDSCVGRKPWCELADLAMTKCQSEGGRLWLYTGSAQALYHVTRRELQRITIDQGRKLSGNQLEEQAKSLLRAFTADKHWLAALAEEGNVFDGLEPEDEQHIKSLARFAPGSIKLLTRDELLCQRYPALTITPQQYLLTQIPHKAIDFIDLKTQQDHIRPTLEQNIHRILAHGQYIMGPEVAQLEEKLAAYVGVKHCISASSGTDTLLIAMMALGIGPGDEVITTPFTFIATGEMIALLGAKPVFVEIDPRTYNIDPSKIDSAITSKTKAIMPVSLYGQCADMDAINAIADKHGLPVIEDAAQSFGATYKGRKSCALSTIGSTSFFPSKPLGGYGDGGALFTNDDTLAKTMKEIRAHGQDRRYHHPRIGINGRLDTLQAAILLAKFERFEWEVQQRQKVGARYTTLLSSSKGNGADEIIKCPYIEPYNSSVYAQYTVQINNRDAIVKRLNDVKIPTTVHYPSALHLQPALAIFGYGEGDFPIAEITSRQVLSLPIGPDLGELDQEVIASALLGSLHAHN